MAVDGFPAVLTPGAMFLHYRIERQLGQGGMSTVYLVRNTRLNRFEALKVLAAHLAGDDSIRARFRQEAQSVAALEDRNVVTVFDFGAIAAPQHAAAGSGEAAPELLWLTMQYVQGQDAAQLLRADPGGLHPAQAIDIVAQAAAGIDAAHRAGLIHRDVKPANLLVTPGWNGLPGSQRVLVSDFGIARTAQATSRRTAAGAVIGTLAYLSPESLTDAHVDYRTDIYALGCTLCELLTGTVPFPRPTTAAQLTAHLHDAPPKVSERRPGLPPALDQVLARAMAKDPAQRYRSCGELAAAAASAFAPAPAQPEHRTIAFSHVPPQRPLPPPAHAPLQSQTHTPPPPIKTSPTKRRAIVAAVVAALVIAAAIAGLVVFHPWSDSTTTTATTPTSAAPEATRRFATPTGNIVCRLTSGGSFTGVLCEIANHSFTVPGTAPRDCAVAEYGSRFELTPNAPATLSCRNDPLRAAGTPTLEYGDSVTLAGITCESRSSALTCSDTHGHYFRLSIQSYDLR